MLACGLSMKQQASEDEIHEGLNNMCDDIGCPLKFHKDKILHFDDTSGPAAAAQWEVTFEDISSAAAAAHRKVEKEASYASYRASKKFPNNRKCIYLERETCNKHNSISDLTTPPKRNKLTIKHIIPGCYVYGKEDLRPGMHSHGGTGYVTECIGENYLRKFK